MHIIQAGINKISDKTLPKYPCLHLWFTRLFPLLPSLPSCRKILQSAKLKDFQIGKSKVFLKYWHVDRLNELLERVHKAAMVLQKGIHHLPSHTITLLTKVITIVTVSTLQFTIYEAQ